MNKHTSQIITYELVWWLLTAIVCLLVYLRVSSGFDTYPYLAENMIFIVTFITFTRWVFLLRVSVISLSRNLMIALIFLAIPLFLYILTQYRSFKMYWDDGELIKMMSAGDYESKMAIANFFKQEMIFFGVAAMLAVFIFPFKLVKAIWKKHNKGYV